MDRAFTDYNTDYNSSTAVLIVFIIVTIIIIMESAFNASIFGTSNNVPSAFSTIATNTSTEYDDHGAAVYTIVVLTFYALVIVTLIGIISFSKHHSDEEEVDRYLNRKLREEKSVIQLNFHYNKSLNNLIRVASDSTSKEQCRRLELAGVAYSKRSSFLVGTQTLENVKEEEDTVMVWTTEQQQQQFWNDVKNRSNQAAILQQRRSSLYHQHNSLTSQDSKDSPPRPPRIQLVTANGDSFGHFSIVSLEDGGCVRTMHKEPNNTQHMQNKSTNHQIEPTYMQNQEEPRQRLNSMTSTDDHFGEDRPSKGRRRSFDFYRSMPNYRRRCATLCETVSSAGKAGRLAFASNRTKSEGDAEDVITNPEESQLISEDVIDMENDAKDGVENNSKSFTDGAFLSDIKAFFPSEDSKAYANRNLLSCK